MAADVDRAVYSWDVHQGICTTVRDRKRMQLSEVMHATLQAHGRKLAYFQGFHDIVLVFLEVATPSEAYHMIERLALFHLSDQLCWPFDKGLMPLLRALFGLLKIVDLPVAQALHDAECSELHFAVPWVLTWFAHSLPHLHRQVTRLFDCLLTSHPTMILYFAADLLLQHREQLLSTGRELPEMVLLLQNLPFASLDVCDWAQRALQLSRTLPPEQLLRRLSTHDLPFTSPLLHYPHPWMAQDRRQRAKKPSEAADIFALAPIYCARPSLSRRGWAALSNAATKVRAYAPILRRRESTPARGRLVAIAVLLLALAFSSKAGWLRAPPLFTNGA
eukprot:NODE_10193_length_1370_cov_5.212389.p1 GENE.NODE_10193_length_1370_cov_5.212389~~NODE_10193_length_1370_cov_5.212389.p1  ORF type:complete len:356 (-),score=105.76 NODE_10193_length_1370_cov_5.212389:302-1300(-)